MKVSLNLVKEYLDLPIGKNELVELIGRRLGEVEQVIDLKSRFKGALIGRVVACQPHPQTSKLKICQVDDGAQTQAPRDSDGYLNVVCAGANVVPGQQVVYLAPGVSVPATAASDQPQVLAAKEIKGVVSQGMIASLAELGLGESEADILDLAEADNPYSVALKPGADFAKTYALDDFLIDIENKMFTHRPDCFGLLGVAREIAGINHQAFKSPAWYTLKALKTTTKDEQLTVAINDQAPVSRLSARVIDSVTVKPSPLKFQFKLATLGFKPINNIVDITNWVMYLMGQPLHAFDYHKLQARSQGQPPTLMARLSKPAESLKLLGGKTLKFDKPATVIATDSQVVALAGIMGGSETEVDHKTTKIVLEAATFDMYDLRRSTMHYGIFTEAATRFTKGQSPHQNLIAQTLAAELIQQLAHAQASPSYHDTASNLPAPAEVTFEPEFINRRLGAELTPERISELLTNVEFDIKPTTGSALRATVPFWRSDIAIAEDLVEEVGRLGGYENLELKLPTRPALPPPVNQLLELKKALRTCLSAGGANEVLSYSFVGQDFLHKATQPPELAYQLTNALSPKLEYYRLSLTPSLLEFVYPNLRQNYDQFALFEIGVAHSQDRPLEADNLPSERQLIALVCSQKAPQGPSAFYVARRYLDLLAAKLALEFSYQPLEANDQDPLTKVYHPQRSARVICGVRPIGVVGEFKSQVATNFKLPPLTAGFEIDTDLILKAPHQTIYQPLLVYPASYRDLTLQVAKDLSYSQLAASLREVLTKTGHWFSLEPVSIYSADDKTKNVSFHVRVAATAATLTNKEVSKIVEQLVQRARKDHRAQQI